MSEASHMTVDEFFEMDLPPARAAAVMAAADWLRGQDDPLAAMSEARDRFGLSAMAGCRALEQVRRSAEAILKAGSVEG